MGARTRLNTFYAASGLITAAVIGAVFDSWIVFGLVSLIAVGSMLTDSRIRLYRQLRRHHRRFQRPSRRH